MKVWMEEIRKEWEKKKEGLLKRLDNLEKRLENGESGEREERSKKGENRVGENLVDLERRMRRLKLEGERQKEGGEKK